MSSLSWYLCLAVGSVVIAIFAIYKKRHSYKISTLAVFYLFTACITWIGEFIVLGIFNSYAYKPGIFTDPWAENLTGHLFLNASMFPAAAIIWVTYSLGYLGMSLIIAAFILPEYLFLKLGIYEQHWWRYYMSVINTSIFLIIVKKWFTKVEHAQYNIPRLLTLYFVGFLIIHIPAPLLLLLGKQHYTLGLIEKLVGNMYRSSIIFIFSYHLVEVALLVFFVCVPDKWYWKLVPFAIAYIGQGLLVQMNILVFEEGWQLAYSLLLYTLCLLVFMFIEKYTLKPD